jgi:LmbE family N-acetylglucosaminyl deacetylase
MMRVMDFLDAARALPVVSLPAITHGRALILAPHPDDESLGCGGLIAAACARGEPPVVVVLTDGAASHPNSRAWPSQRLRALRERETRSAVAHLGLRADHVFFLRYPDTQAPSDGPRLRMAAEVVAALARAHGCRSILAAWGCDPHCDHEAAHRIAALAARGDGLAHRAYPVWGLTLPPDRTIAAEPRGWRLDVSPWLAAKQRAIRAHRSQYAGLITDDPAGFQMPPGFMSLFAGPWEIFLEVA